MRCLLDARTRFFHNVVSFIHVWIFGEEVQCQLLKRMQTTQEECGYGDEGRAKAAASPTDHKQHQVRENGLLTVYMYAMYKTAQPAATKTVVECSANYRQSYIDAVFFRLT